MGVIVSKDRDQNSRLAERINSDLRERAKKEKDVKDPDLVEDSDYARDLKKTGHFGWVWAILIILALASIVVIVAI